MLGGPERRSRRRGGRRATVGVAAVGLVLAGALAAALSQGYIVIDGAADTAIALSVPPDRVVVPDTTRGIVARRRTPDSQRTAGAPPVIELRRPAAPPPESAAVVAPRLTGITAVATRLELETLRVGLVIPVAGVTREQLIDSFDEARADRGAIGAETAPNRRRHDALDIMAPRGTPVVSATAGRVLRLFESRAGGLMVYASDATERFVLLYAHLDRYADGLREGALLRAGETIGYVGTTGNAAPNAPHLHFGIARTTDVTKWSEGTPINPYPLLR